MESLPVSVVFLLLVVSGSASAGGGGGKNGCRWRQSSSDTVDCTLRILDFRRNSTDSFLASVLQSRARARARTRTGARKERRLRHLNVECSDVFYFESRLRSDHFGALPRLESLSVRRCKIRALPPRAFVGLSALRRLEVRTGNADWTQLALEPDYEALVGLRRLEELDLSLNNLSGLPAGLLCPLASVRSVNLSGNAFHDLADVGIRESECQVKKSNYTTYHFLFPWCMQSVQEYVKLIDVQSNF